MVGADKLTLKNHRLSKMKAKMEFKTINCHLQSKISMIPIALAVIKLLIGKSSITNFLGKENSNN